MSHQYFHYLGWHFDIDHANRLIASAPRETVDIDPAQAAAAGGIDPAAAKNEGGVTGGLVAIDQAYAMSVDLSKPLIVATIHGAADHHAYLLIDGWHRLYKAAATHVPVLSAYVLTFDEVLAISNLVAVSAASRAARRRGGSAPEKTSS